jgi:hypothetical protein
MMRKLNRNSNRNIANRNIGTSRFALLPLVLLLGACATVPPSGPSILVLPGTGKNFDQFRVDDMDCRQYAGSQIGGATPGGAAESSAVRSAAAGTAIGTLAGSAIGGRSGAGVGAGTGLIVGSVAGTSASASSAGSLQQRYDFGFQQCMYAKGHRVPAYGRFTESRPAVPPPPPPQYTPPPPPPNAPPPPPPNR